MSTHTYIYLSNIYMYVYMYIDEYIYLSIYNHLLASP